MNPFLIAVYILLGFIVGVTTGITGMGAAVLLAPALILLGVEPLQTVGTVLVFMIITKIVGTILHRKKGHVNLRLGLIIVIGAVPSIIIANIVFFFIDKDEVNKYLTFVLAGLLVLLSILSIVRNFKKDALHVEIDVNSPKGTLVLLITGFIIGLCMMFTSVGAGVIIVFSLVFILHQDPRMVVGTSIMAGLVLSVLSGVSHLFQDNVDLQLVSVLAIGSIIGIFLGTYLITKIHIEKLKKSFGFIILILGIITFISAILEW